jgi:hypothetical protein
VPEVWRFHTRKKSLWFGRRDGDSYVEIHHSLALPMLTPHNVIEALGLGAELSESEWDPKLRAWARGRFGRA